MTCASPIWIVLTYDVNVLWDSIASSTIPFRVVWIKYWKTDNGRVNPLNKSLKGSNLKLDVFVSLGNCSFNFWALFYIFNICDTASIVSIVFGSNVSLEGKKIFWNIGKVCQGHRWLTTQCWHMHLAKLVNANSNKIGIG